MPSLLPHDLCHGRSSSLAPSSDRIPVELETELEKSELENAQYRKQITELERTIDNLKLADAFKAGNADNTEARKKIDRLIKEIDKCITLMEG